MKIMELQYGGLPDLSRDGNQSTKNRRAHGEISPL